MDGAADNETAPPPPPPPPDVRGLAASEAAAAARHEELLLAIAEEAGLDPVGGPLRCLRERKGSDGGCVSEIEPFVLSQSRRHASLGGRAGWAGPVL